MEFRFASNRPPTLRDHYFASLPAPQVHYLEQRVSAARTALFGPADHPAGYMSIHDGAVVEFFALDELAPQLEALYHAAAAAGGATSAVVKSYDARGLAAAAGRPARVAVIGVNCTAWLDTQYEAPPGFSVRSAHAGDAAILLAIGQGLFEAPDIEIPSSLEAGEVRIYELHGEPVGCGLLTPVRRGAHDALDIGVGVLPAHRGKGFGEQIVRHLKRLCLSELGAHPVCGCAVDNLASRRTLERAGFVTSHRLLEFAWAP